MHDAPEIALITRRYREIFDARLTPCFQSYIADVQQATGAALGYRRAGEEPLFLEAYLDHPIEQAVSMVLGRPTERDRIVEIGNFAAENAMAMIDLWGTAANDLGGRSEVAVATLTAPLRRIFARIGIPVHEIAPARRERIGADSAAWGRYYESDPRICAGLIAEGQGAIAAFMARRRRKVAA
ncbi:MAG: thermostable hemolysin [Sphingobium sp.]